MANKVPYLNSTSNANAISAGFGSKTATSSSNSKYFSLNTKGLTSPNGIGSGTKPVKGVKATDTKGNLDYNYGERRIDSSKTLSEIVNDLHLTVNLPGKALNTHKKILSYNSTHYNRFKIANPNDNLIKGYSHVFFVAPSCNILGSDGTTLHSQFSGNDLYEYVKKTSPEVLGELSRYNKRNTDFSLLLSNYVKSFSLSDEYINTDTYGRTFTGYKVSFGKNNIESKTAGSFDVTFSDTRNLDIYKLHRVWADYISGAFRGLYSPRNEDILLKILDYTGAVYYIMTAEDNETILFWSKYYGVYPSTVPSTQYSWGEGNAVSKPDLNITYQYSFKEDYNPSVIQEFNYNARISGKEASYLPIYDSKLGHVGSTYVSVPFIEIVNDTNGYYYKLRFKE